MGHYEQERALEEQISTVLSVKAPRVRVLDVELNNPQQTVRVFITTPEGVTVEDCTEVTRLIRDVTDFALEVSSPGEHPPIRQPEHFAENIGSQVRLKSSDEHKAFVATLTAAGEEAITVTRGDGDVQTLPYTKITRCKLLTEQRSMSTGGGTTS